MGSRPISKPIEFTDPCPYEACLDFENAGKLAEYLDAVERWMRDAETQCNKEDTP